MSLLSNISQTSSSKREMTKMREDYHGFMSNTSLTSSICKSRSARSLNSPQFNFITNYLHKDPFVGPVTGMSFDEGQGTAVNILIGKHCYGKNLKQQKPIKQISSFQTDENNPTAFSHNKADLIRENTLCSQQHILLDECAPCKPSQSVYL